MPGFFEALQNLKPDERPKPSVMIEGKRMEVSLEKFKEIMRHGETEYEIKQGKIVRKMFKGALKESLVLDKTDDKGYIFIDAHPYWPDKIVEGGYEWRIGSE